MHRTLFAAMTLALAVACSPAPAPTPPAQVASASPTETVSPAPADLAALENYRDWGNGDAAEHDAAFKADAKRIVMPMTREQTIDALPAAGYSCQYGEAHQDYPNPAQVCTREFATRACQMTWEITTEAENSGVTKNVDASFARDCVGTDRDYPEPKNSEIDSQLAPPNLPTGSPAPH